MISSLGCSEFDSGPGDFVFSLWVEVGWIVKLTIVVLGVESGLGILADLDEVGDELSVGEVLVEIVLEVLDQVHMLLNEVISSNSWEGESVVIELPSVDGKLWRNAELLLELFVDLHGVIVVLSVEASREIIQFNVKLLLSDWEGLVTWHLDVESVSWVLLEVDSKGRSGHTEEGYNKIRGFHL